MLEAMVVGFFMLAPFAALLLAFIILVAMIVLA